MNTSNLRQTNKQLTPKDKKILYFSLVTILIFVIFWQANDFMTAVASVLFLYAVYFIIKAFRNKPYRKKSLLTAVPLLLLAVICMPPQASQQKSEDNHKSSVAPKPETKKVQPIKSKKQETVKPINWYPVTEVVNSNTIKIVKDGKAELVQLIGIETPNVAKEQCYAKETLASVQHYVQDKKVRLEADKSQGDKNGQGSLLRHIYTETNTNVAKAMILDGAAKERAPKEGYKNQKDYKNSQKKAQSKKKGLWDKSNCNGNIKQTDPKIVKQREEKKRSELAAAEAAKIEQQRQAQQQAAIIAAEAERQRQVIAEEAARAAAIPPASSAYYSNCSAARAAGAAPVYAGQPGYGSHLDRDGDGVGCER